MQKYEYERKEEVSLSKVVAVGSFFLLRGCCNTVFPPLWNKQKKKCIKINKVQNKRSHDLSDFLASKR